MFNNWLRIKNGGQFIGHTLFDSQLGVIYIRIIRYFSRNKYQFTIYFPELIDWYHRYRCVRSSFGHIIADAIFSFLLSSEETAVIISVRYTNRYQKVCKLDSEDATALLNSPGLCHLGLIYLLAKVFVSVMLGTTI